MTIDLTTIFILSTIANSIAMAVTYFHLSSKVKSTAQALEHIANAYLIMLNNMRGLDKALVEQQKIVEKFNR